MLANCLTRCRLFTVLRHPVPRVMSLFRFLRQQPLAEQRRLGLQAGFGFDDFIGSQHPELFGQIHDGMTRMLSGIAALNTAHTPHFWTTEPSPATVEAALVNLERFDFGLVEDMETTLALARHAWGVPYEFTLGHENVTNPTGAEPDSERSLQVILRNPMDLALYQGAAAMLRSRRAWLAATVATDAAHRVVHAPALGQDTPISAIPGLQGFHDVEETGIAWLHAEQPARLHFDLSAASVRIRLAGYAVLADYPVEEIELSVNGRRLAITVDRLADKWFTIEAPVHDMGPRMNVLAIRPPYFVPLRHLEPGGQDRRSLSIALARVAFDA
jgi:hypothetical protein